jgi:hypothetical protein
MLDFQDLNWSMIKIHVILRVEHFFLCVRECLLCLVLQELKRELGSELEFFISLSRTFPPLLRWFLEWSDL